MEGTYLRVRKESGMRTKLSTRLIAILLCAVLICALLPLSAMAETTEVADTTTEEVVEPDDTVDDGDEDEEEDIYASAVSVGSAKELTAALAAEAKAILITADFQLDTTFYCISDTVIYTEEAHTLTRSPEFSGDIFVVGQYEDGTVCEGEVRLQLGHETSDKQDLLVIDGNRDNMTVEVDGTVFFVCSNARLVLHTNLTVKNCKKVSNVRALDASYGLSYPERIGGPVAIAAGGKIDIYGGTYTNNSANDEQESEDGETSLLSTQGGAFYFFGNARIYGGTFTQNHAHRGGAFYVYRTLNIYGGSIKENTASDKGGALYMAASTLCYLNMEGDNDDGGILFKDNHADVFGGALYCQGVQVTIDSASFEGNTANSHGGAVYCLISGDEDTDARFTAINSSFNNNTTDYNGGAVYLSGSSAYFENVTFDGNHAKATANSEGNRYGGGALYATGSYVEINGAQIKNNTSDNYGGGLEAHSSSKLVLNNITTSGNDSVANGGFIFANNSAIEIYNSAIRGNHTDGQGAAVHIVNSATLHAYVTTFENNRAESNGGALYIYTGAVTSLLHSCVFLDNVSGNYGGAMYVSKASILNAYNTSAKGNSAYRGGFMYETTTDTTVTLNGLSVSGNTATDAGPIIYGNTTKSILYLNKTNYIDVDATAALDDAYWATAIVNNLTVEEITDAIPGFTNYGDTEETPADSIVNPNVTNAIELQAALAAGLKEITIISDFTLDRTFYVTKNVTIYASGNRTLTRAQGFGGDLFVIGESVDGEACETAISVAIKMLDSDSTLIIDGNKANMTVSVTGTVFFICNDAKLSLYDGLTVQNCQKVANERTLNEAYNLSYPERIGGPVAIVARAELEIYGGNYSNNQVNDESDDDMTSTQGGAIYNYGTTSVYGGSFANNKAARGGAFYNYRNLYIYNAKISGNSASTAGGGIYMAASTMCYLNIGGASNVTDSNVLFENNTSAGNGGAILNQGVLTRIENATFVGNSSGNHGGAIHTSVESTGAEDIKLVVRDSSFTDNKADYNGGAVYLTKTAATFRNVDFSSNHSYATANDSDTRYGGGAIYSTGSYSHYVGVRFTGNSSDYAGGAVMFNSSSEALMYNVVAKENTAQNQGGFLYSKSTVTVYDSLLAENTAANGGAMALITPAVTNVYNTEFNANASSSNGGALYVYTKANETLLHSCSFTENTADNYGGAMYASNASIVKALNITATSNSAYRGGFLYETTTDTTVTLNGLSVSGNTASDAGPIIYGNTTKSILYLNKTNYIDMDATTALDDAYWATAIVNKLTVEEITDSVEDYDEYGDENYDDLAGYVGVYNADELEQAVNEGRKYIRVMADIELDRTIYIASNITIFSTTPYRITRKADFGSDMFVVGEMADGTSCLVENVEAKLTLGNPASDTEELLTIDGNRNAMTVDVVGSVLFICHSAQVDIYSNVAIVNTHKDGNERTLNERYDLSYSNRVSGSVAVIESGVLNIYGGIFRNHSGNDEIISEEVGEEGRDATLGGAFYNRGAFNIYGGTFEYCKAARGGLVYNYRMLHIYGGSFLNNYASAAGGVIYCPSSEYSAVYVGGTTGDATVHFADNVSAKSGGVIYAGVLASTIIYGDTEFIGNRAEKGNGGAIYASGVLIAENTVFSENYAYTYGGAAYLVNTSDVYVIRLSRINNCQFLNNIANKGGAVTAYASNSTLSQGANVTINNSVFTENIGEDRVKSKSTSLGYGGAIVASNKSHVTINGSTFTGNSADTEGGAIYMAYESTVNITDSQFTENASYAEAKGYGGAISMHSSYLNAERVDFTNNTALTRAGALYISYNSSSLEDAVAKLTDCTFTGNHTDSQGGAIYTTDRKISYGVDEEGLPLPSEDNNTLNLILINTQLSENTADNKGGAMYIANYSHAYMNNVKFLNNAANGEESGHNAGAIYCAGYSTFEINGGEFTGNTAGANGGAIGMYSNSSAVMNNVTANGNSAVTSAGFMILDTAYATIYNSTIENNTAGHTAGAISMVDLATLHAYDTDFIGNHSVKDGGAVYAYAGAVTSVLNGCTFRQNSSEANGGAIYVSNKSLVELYNITVEQNSANKGGFMYETTSSTKVILNGVTLTGNTANAGGPIIWGNTTNAKLYLNKQNYTDTESAVLDETYWASAIYNLLTVEEITDEIPDGSTYTDSYVFEEEEVTVHKEVDVEHIFQLAQSSSDKVINSYYGALPRLDNSSNFMSKNTTYFPDINGTTVTADTFVYQKGDTANNVSVGEGLLIYQAMLYKRANPDEDVKISVSAFRFSIAAAVCINRDSRYFGYMRNLYGVDYDAYGFVRISYLLLCAARMGIDVTVVGQLDGNPYSKSDPNLGEYFTEMLDAPCDSNYISDGVIGDYMTFSHCKWVSYDNKGATDMMHTKLCAVSHYLDKDGNVHKNAVWTSSSNLDGIQTSGVNGVNKLQTATLISDHEGLYQASANYVSFVAQYCEQEDVYIFRDLAIKRSTEQIDLIYAGRESEIPEDQKIVYLGTENDSVFELYFAPFGGELCNWEETYNPFTKYLRAMQNSEDYIILTWNNVKFVECSLRFQMEDVIIDAFHKNADPNNRIYVNLPTFDKAAFKDLTVGEDIGYMSFGAVDSNNIHSKDLQVSYVQNGQRSYVSLLNSMNVHGGSTAYQSNFCLVIKETNCDEDSVFFTLADETTSGIVAHAYQDEVLEHIPEDTTQDGYTYQACANCDERLILSTIHRSGDWVIDRQATAEHNGVAHKSCLACSVLLESMEFVYPGDDITLDLSQTMGKTFTVAKDAENALDVTETPHTFEAIIQLDKSVNGRGGVIVGNYDNSLKNQINLEVYTYGKLRLFFINDGKREEHIFNTDIRSSEESVHVAVTVDGTTAKLYLNGELKETAILTMELPKIDGKLWIGGDNRSSNSQYFKGTIYAASLFSDVRTETELIRDAVSVFPEEDGILASKYFYITESVSETVKPVGKTFTAETISAVGTLTATPHTIEAVVMVPEDRWERAGVIIGNYDGAAAPRLNLEVYDGGKIRLYLHNGTKSATYLFPADIRSSTPTHLALTIDGLTASLYVNGELKGTQTLSFSVPETTESFRVGGDNRTDNLQYFKGTIYSVNLFEGVRTADQIAQDMVLVSGETDGLLFSRYFAQSLLDTNMEIVSGTTFTESTAHKVDTLAETPRTIEATIQVNKAQADRAGVVVGNYDGLFHGLMNLEIYHGGRVRLYYSTDDGIRENCIFDPDIRSNEPVHVAVTVDGLTATLYINGELAQVKQLSVEPGTAVEDFKVGGDNRQGNTQYFKGTICDVSLFSDVRTAEEIKADMTSVSADAEGLLYNHIFSVTEHKELLEIIPSGKTFTEENSIVASKDLSSTPKTLEAVVQIDKAIDGRAGVIVGNYDGLFHELMNLEIYYGGRPRLYYATVDGTRIDCTFNTDIRSDKPVHVAVTIDGLTATLYVNGQQTEQKTLPYELPVITKDFKIGGDNRQGNTQYFKGNLYSVSLFDSVRTAGQILNDMISVDTTDTALLYSTMFVSDVCAQNGHTESEWIQDAASTELGYGIRHTVCTVCGKLLQCVKTPQISEVVDHRDFQNAEGFTPDENVYGIALEELTAGPLTFEATIQLDEKYSQRAGVVIGNYDGSTADQVNFEIYTSGKPRLYYKVNNVAYSYNFKTDIRSETPVHIALTVDGLTAKLYVNGVLKETATLTAELPTVTNNFYVGCDNRSGAPQYFKGTIYTAGLYEGVRTAEQVAIDRYLTASDSEGLLYNGCYIKNN